MGKLFAQVATGRSLFYVYSLLPHVIALSWILVVVLYKQRVIGHCAVDGNIFGHLLKTHKRTGKTGSNVQALTHAPQSSTGALMAVDADVLTIWEGYNMAAGLGVTSLLVEGDSSLITSCLSHLFGREVY